ncbi:MAG TPA: hypothetical protein VK361_06910 [Rubrobacteraceae bacterium]|nr:hypothetical protein [Rubrobacteraceae bacterium]
MSEYVQFAGAVALLVVILIGSYWFVVTSARSPEQRRVEEKIG